MLSLLHRSQAEVSPQLSAKLESKLLNLNESARASIKRLEINTVKKPQEPVQATFEASTLNKTKGKMAPKETSRTEMNLSLNKSSSALNIRKNNSS